MLAALAAFRADAGYVDRRRARVGAARARGAGCSRRSSGRCPRTPPAGCCRARVERDPRGGRARGRGRARARASGAATARASSCGSLLEQLRRCPSCSTPTASGGSSRSSARPPTVLTPHAGELARPARDASRRRSTPTGSTSVRRAASRFGSVVLLKGADTLVAAPREGVLVAAYGAPVARDRRHRRRAHRRDRRVPRQGHRAASRRRGRRRRARARLAARRAAGGLVASDLLPGIQRALAGEGATTEPLELSAGCGHVSRGPTSAWARANALGASAWSQAAGRYQRGTKISRRSCSTASRIRRRRSCGSTTNRRSGNAKPVHAAGSPASRRSPG